MVIGLFASSTLVGRRISETGRYKRWMMLGGVLLTTGLLLMGTLDETTSLYELGVFMFLIGTGVGMLMQNLVLVVQNAIPLHDMGAGSSLIAFFRSLGGAIGVSVLGAVLAERATSTIKEGLAASGAPAEAARSLEGGQVPNLHELPASLARLIEHAYGVGVGEIFLVAAPLSFVALIAVTLLREERLGEQSGLQRAAEESRA